MTYIHHSRRARMSLVTRRRLCARGHLRAQSVCAPVCIQTTGTDVPLFFADEHAVAEGEVPYWVYSPYHAFGSMHRGCDGGALPTWGYGCTKSHWTDFVGGTVAAHVGGVSHVTPYTLSYAETTTSTSNDCQLFYDIYSGTNDEWTFCFIGWRQLMWAPFVTRRVSGAVDEAHASN